MRLDETLLIPWEDSLRDNNKIILLLFASLESEPRFLFGFRAQIWYQTHDSLHTNKSFLVKYQKVKPYPNFLYPIKSSLWRWKGMPLGLDH